MTAVRWPRVTLTQARAILTDHSKVAELDASAAEKWHKGVLSPRQQAGFYEIRPERHAYAMGLYRARVKLIERVAKWRRANPEPSSKHTILFARPERELSAINFRVGGLSEPWAAYRSDAMLWDGLSKAKQAKTPSPAMPARGPREDAHDTSFQLYNRGDAECPLCLMYQAIRGTWAARRRVFMAGQGIDVGNTSYAGRPSVQWPDGSWDTDVNYQPLPIRSSRAVGRTNITKEATE